MRILLAILITMFSFVAHADNEDRRIRVHNETGKRIVGLFASPIDNKAWRYNMLTNTGPIRGHDTIMADIDDGTGYCRYDLLAVFPNGDSATKMDVNVCTLTDWYIYP